VSSVVVLVRTVLQVVAGMVSTWALRRLGVAVDAGVIEAAMVAVLGGVWAAVMAWAQHRWPRLLGRLLPPPSYAVRHGLTDADQ
jgi:hypothetical protein